MGDGAAGAQVSPAQLELLFGYYLDVASCTKRTANKILRRGAKKEKIYIKKEQTVGG